jgi:pyruvate formate lyase activating enzyme
MKHSAPFIGINRNRLATDGAGVTTLVAFWDCPLSCKYCLNPQSLDKKADTRVLTTEELYHITKIDELYFLATHGGVTFGGGEPGLYPDFINEFRKYCGEQWTITLETCLNVPFENVKVLHNVVNNYIVDIKDVNADIYKRYTGKENDLPIANLKWLIEQGNADKICVRVPMIPNYNTEKDIENSILELKQMGIKHFDAFSYTLKPATL